MWDELADWLQNEQADILALQEVYKSDDQSLEKRYRSLEELSQALALPYYSFAPAFRDLRFEVAEMGNGVLSKFPVEAENVVFYDVPYDDNFTESEDFTYVPRNLQHVTVRIGGNTLNVFNTQGIWGLDGDDNERRLNMAKTIVKEIGDKENVVLAGDFNVKEKTKTVGIIEERLTNVFKGELKSSFNMKRKKDGGFGTAVVDMIFVSKEIKIVEHYVPKVDVTDHMPLAVVLEI